MEDTPERKPEQLFTVSDAANYLKLSTRTIWRMIDLQIFKDLVIMPRQKRRYVRFSQSSFDTFIAEYASGMKTEERPKRAYHRTKKKYARKKKTVGKKGKAA